MQPHQNFRMKILNLSEKVGKAVVAAGVVAAEVDGAKSAVAKVAAYELRHFESTQKIVEWIEQQEQTHQMKILQMMLQYAATGGLPQPVGVCLSWKIHFQSYRMMHQSCGVAYDHLGKSESPVVQVHVEIDNQIAGAILEGQRCGEPQGGVDTVELNELAALTAPLKKLPRK